MKTLVEFLLENTNNILNESYFDIYNKYDIIGDMPKNVCIALNSWGFTSIDKNEKVKIVVNNSEKKILVQNCKRIYITTTAAYKFINTNWKIFFDEIIDITIGSGTRGSNMELAVFYNGDSNLTDIAKLFAFDDNNKFNTLELYRFNCENGIPDKDFLDILNINLLYFEQCSHITNMPLPDKRTFKNKNLKFNSDKSRATTYFAENGLLIGGEEEVKSHMRKGFLKEYELNQAKEKERQEIIKASKENPYNIYTYNYKEDDYCVIREVGGLYYLIWAFPSTSALMRKWPSDLDIIEGVYISIDYELYIIEKIYPSAAGSFTGGAVINEFKLIKA